MDIVTKISHAVSKLLNVESKYADFVSDIDYGCEGPFVKWPDVARVFLLRACRGPIEFCRILQSDR